MDCSTRRLEEGLVALQVNAWLGAGPLLTIETQSSSHSHVARKNPSLTIVDCSIHVPEIFIDWKIQIRDAIISTLC